ncbi:phosphoserine phosphatase SerB [Roseibacterium sp. SDUM158016]|uniref:phosphoserine phosphatase SerB n=1 Tax=Roseicyclus sediminis TaxID=2980997 RepID=UPI0021CE5F63|nr:phosphoserine phosphatase SerB [Roseibacterium sp. SDUM158016]MCU4652235.1 phosphoserine phosphatase SerB [Roseibacterium sp. SDUM158016]
MFTITLITNPAMYLDPTLVGNLRNAMGGGDAAWLDPSHAAEFDVSKLPRNLPQIWESLQAEGVDMVAQPAGNRRRRMLLADMDSTMIGQECIDELAAEAGVGKAVSAITARAMNGELDFEGALTERVGLLKGLPEGVIGEVLDRRITAMPGGATLVATMKKAGAHTVLVSGGFTAFAETVAERLGFDEFRANVLLAENGILTGDVARPILGREAKVEALEEITARLGITPADVLAIGDGANDLGMIGRAGTGVAVHAKPVVQEAAPHRINHGDLTALLFLQGFARDEFVSA